MMDAGRDSGFTSAAIHMSIAQAVKITNSKGLCVENMFRIAIL
jgi:hypothetical protein